MFANSLEEARRLILEIRQPGNDPTIRLERIAEILVDVCTSMQTEIDGLKPGEIERAAHNQQPVAASRR